MQSDNSFSGEIHNLKRHIASATVNRPQAVEVKNSLENACLHLVLWHDKKQVQSLLGLASYYRKCLPHFADLTLP